MLHKLAGICFVLGLVGILGPWVGLAPRGIDASTLRWIGGGLFAVAVILGVISNATERATPSDRSDSPE